MKKTFIILLLLFATIYISHSSGTTYSHTAPQSSKKAIIIGASSGIGKALAQILSREGYTLGITGRRVKLLQELQLSLPTTSYVSYLDVSKPEQAAELLNQLAKTMDGYDLIIINAGVGFQDHDRQWKKQKEIINVNVMGFAALAHAAVDHFLEQGYGHLVGISSIAALRGLKNAYTYSASKAFISTYLEGLRNTLYSTNLPLFVTDIQPGFVDTDLVKNEQHKFWESTPEEAALQIYDAIKAKSTQAYVTKRWRLIAWALKLTPDWLYNLVTP